MIAKAKLNYLRLAPRKVRLVTDLISGMALDRAELQLKFLNKRASRPALKLLQSAAANAKSNYNLEKKDLVVSYILVNQGPTLKRWLPRAMGRATPIMKRTSHIEIGLEAKPGVVVKKTSPETKKDKAIQTEKVQPAAKPSPVSQSRELPEEEETDKKPDKLKPARPYGATPEAKKRFFSRQPFSRTKKDFKRKTG